jgi:hypothetical protein
MPTKLAGDVESLPHPAGHVNFAKMGVDKN